MKGDRVCFTGPGCVPAGSGTGQTQKGGHVQGTYRRARRAQRHTTVSLFNFTDLVPDLPFLLSKWDS